MKTSPIVVVALATFLGGAAVFSSACQNTDDAPGGAAGSSAAGGGTGTGGSGASTGGAAGSSSMGAGGATTFAMGVLSPGGCGFQIAGRMEYVDYALGTPVNGPSPNIRRVRLGLGGNVAVGAAGRADPAHTIGVAWQTDDGTLASDIAWGSDPDASKWDAKNRTGGVTWKTPPGQINPGAEERMHEAYVCGLEPAQTYYYRVGGGPAGQEIWSDVFAFRTAPANGDATVTFALTGDSRGEENNAWQILQKRVKGLAPTMQIFTGDMINLAPDQGEWEQWLDKAGTDETGAPSALSSILTVAAHGNHDNHTALFFGNVTLPQDVAAFPTYAELFYSFDVGPVHVVMVDDSFIAAGMPDATAIGDWLDKDLAAANQNRGNVPWIIAAHHRPAYSSSTHGKDADVIKVRTFMTPIWDKHHVDLAVSGHDHNYERTQPLTGPADSPVVQSDPKQGTVYLVCAGAGADAYGAGMSTFTAKSLDYKNGGIGLYSVLTASKTMLKIEGHTLTAAGDDPVFDSYTITKLRGSGGGFRVLVAALLRLTCSSGGDGRRGAPTIRTRLRSASA